MPKKESLASEIYTGTAQFGAIMADLKAVFGALIGIILIGIGISFLVYKITRTELANGTVIDIKNGGRIDPSCSYTTTTTRTDSGTTTSGSWYCTIDVAYTTKDGKSCTLYGQVISSQQKYVQGNGISVWYNPDNSCGDASIYADFSHTIGWILVIVGLVIGISGIVWAWLANKYKVVGAFEGASTGIHMLAGAARY